jgi:hypothetical protein
MNFFNPAFQTTVAEQRFGLCDDENGTPAHVDIGACRQDAWNAVVENPQALDLVFTAIDNAVITSAQQTGKGRCDGMLTHDRNALFFIELKTGASHWISDAIQQLSDTIMLFNEAHPTEMQDFRFKRAYACNRRHPRFDHSNKVKRKQFFQTHKVRLFVEATITV